MEDQQVKQVYVYIDWTTESTPRPFYVGKGTKKRIDLRQRNKKHSNIVKKYGLFREVSLVDSDEIAIQIEIDLIAKHKTFHYDDPTGVGCNFTRGGDGTSGNQPSLETRKKQSDSKKGKKKSPETRKKMSDYAQNRSPETLEKMSKARLGKKLSPETIAKIKYKRALQAPPSAESIAKRVAWANSPEGQKLCGEANRRENWSSERATNVSKIFSKPVVKCDLMGIELEIFQSIQDAAKSMGVTGCAISHAINGHVKTCCGYVWKLATSTIERD